LRKKEPLVKREAAVYPFRPKRQQPWRGRVRDARRGV